MSNNFEYKLGSDGVLYKVWETGKSKPTIKKEGQTNRRERRKNKRK